MGLDALLERLAGSRGAVTPVTSMQAADVTAKPAPLLACTPVTAVMPLEGVTLREAHSHQWTQHFSDAEPLPAALPAEIVALVDDCNAADLYGDEDRETLEQMYTTDPAGTQFLVAEMHARIGRCYRCRHLTRPGLSDGYCTRRENLVHAYGFMHYLPPDKGAWCNNFKDAT